MKFSTLWTQVFTTTTKKKKRQHLKLVVVLFVEVSFYCSFEGTECDIGCHKGENSIVLVH